MGKTTISMAIFHCFLIFNSYVSSPEGNWVTNPSIYLRKPLQDYLERIGLCHFCFAPKGVGVLASQQFLNGGCWRIPLKFLSHVAPQTFETTWNLCLIVFSIGFVRLGPLLMVFFPHPAMIVEIPRGNSLPAGECHTPGGCRRRSSYVWVMFNQ